MLLLIMEHDIVDYSGGLVTQTFVAVLFMMISHQRNATVLRSFLVVIDIL